MNDHNEHQYNANNSSATLAQYSVVDLLDRIE